MRHYAPVPMTHPLKAHSFPVTIGTQRSVATVSWWLSCRTTDEFYAAVARERHRLRWSKHGFYPEHDGDFA